MSGAIHASRLLSITDKATRPVIKQTLAGADSDEIQDFKRAVVARQTSNADEMKQTVFKKWVVNAFQHTIIADTHTHPECHPSYASFVSIAKEISLLEQDMLQLREMLVEWKRTPSLVNNTFDHQSGAGSTTTRSTHHQNATSTTTSNKRNTVANLEHVYKTQLSTLWSQIPGSQQLLPYVPGRHLVCEASDFVELNPATYKVKAPVVLFLFSDALMTAVKKRRRRQADSKDALDSEERRRQESDTDGKLVAEKVYLLSDLTVSDIKDSGSLTNAIKIRRAGKEYSVYRTKSKEDKRVLLAAFRKVAEDQVVRKRREAATAAAVTSATTTSGTGGTTPPSNGRAHSVWTGNEGLDWMSAADRPSVPTNHTMAKVTNTSSWQDDLIMSIATRDYPESVNLILQARTELAGAAGGMTNSSSLDDDPHRQHQCQQLQDLTDQLCETLAHDLSHRDTTKSTSIRLIHHLVQLSQPLLASQSFLAARTSLIAHRTRLITPTGDPVAYVSTLAVVMFTITRYTADWYLSAFEHNDMVSRLIEWVEEQVRAFCAVVIKQVGGQDGDSVREEVVKVVMHHHRKVGGHFFFPRDRSPNTWWV